mgnify:CR=1 FL=1|jgi:hypothetical protein
MPTSVACDGQVVDNHKHWTTLNIAHKLWMPVPATG